MQKVKRILSMVMICSVAIIATLCCPPNDPMTTDQILIASDTIGIKMLPIRPGTMKGTPCNEFKNGKSYTFCIDLQLKGLDQHAEIILTNPKTGKEILAMLVVSGQQKFRYSHMKANVTPEISIRYMGQPTPEDGTFANTTTSACGPGLTVKTSVASTSTQNSSVLVSIDEK